MQHFDDHLRMCVTSRMDCASSLLPLRGASKEWRQSVWDVLRCEIRSRLPDTLLADDMYGLWDTHLRAHGCRMKKIFLEALSQESSMAHRTEGLILRRQPLELGRGDFRFESDDANCKYVSRRHLLFTFEPFLSVSIVTMTCLGMNGSIVHRGNGVFFVDEHMTFPVEFYDHIQVTDKCPYVLIVMPIQPSKRLLTAWGGV